MELADEMKKEGLTQTELARKYGISRARVNQWLSLLGLSDREKGRLQAMGDNWDRRVITERGLRSITRQGVN
ncbi:MAG: helix-turn-helix domain-containing protein [Candidatus Fermentibacteraceae bacterium]|nr:helix-turn-helix domain-containing protein [Candidatus Fermentibacteraceae bacterium]